ncbi:MarC family protein [Magnetofaba australis]|uniref:UPF0056 membrane protein n=1 Tax=Magnetofaba australis IT-1 TaxID=1434232 RepID=A0A1Y2K7F8_9PROT|nr:MarC family protein [Magnetofaba australis]OSM06158.1 putative MarC integral membrane family protein [Magnetofaba australis IT-1]
MENWTEYTRFIISLLAILAPFAAIPIFLSLTHGETERSKAKTAFIAVTTVFSTLTIAAFSGEWILTLLGTSLDAFRVGGGIVLLLIALSMLNAKLSMTQHTREELDEAQQKSAVGAVPIGLPLLAGPGAISSAIIQMQRGEGALHATLIILCILIVCAIVWLFLRFASIIGRALGVIGLNILNRIFGLLLAAVAAQIMANGFKGLFPGWAG